MKTGTLVHDFRIYSLSNPAILGAVEPIKPVPDPHKVLWFGEKASRGHLFVQHLELK